MIANAPLDPPFRADHVGSLLRPQKLISARQERAKGKISDADLKVIENEAIREVVRMQESLGLRSITDGEFRRANYISDFFEGVFGKDSIEFVPSKEFFHHNERGERSPAAELIVRGPARWNGPIFAADVPLLQLLTDRTIKTTVPSPVYVHYAGGRRCIDSSVYPDLDAFWSDIVDVYVKEMAALFEAGCTYLQIDETSIVKLGDPSIRAILENRGEDISRLTKQYAEVLNAVLARAPSGMRVGIHACRGNNRGMWQADAGYETTADTLFNDIRAQFYFLEYDSPRAGTFEALRRVPDDRTIVLGLVTTKSGVLESADVLQRRIDDASRYIDLDRLALSPQCGFASGTLGNDLTLEEQNAKLRRIVEVAQTVWG